MVLFAYLRRLRSEKLQKVAEALAAKAKHNMPITTK